MAAYNPPTEQLPIFDNSVFNSINGDTVLTVSIANLLYLRKTFPDTATALETFSAGILTNNIQSLTVSTALGIGNSQTSGQLLLGSSASVPRSGAVTIANGASNTCDVNISNTAGTALLPTTGAVNIASGSGVASSYTVGVNIGAGSNVGNVIIGNSGNITQIESATLSVVSPGIVSIKAQEAATSEVRIATGGGVNNAIVKISTGTTTGAVTIGNPTNITNLNSGTVNISRNTSGTTPTFIEAITTSTSASLEFHSSGLFNTGFDSKIIATGGTVSDDKGTLTLQSKVAINGTLTMNTSDIILKTTGTLPPSGTALGGKVVGTLTTGAAMPTTGSAFATLTIVTPGIYLFNSCIQFTGTTFLTTPVSCYTNLHGPTGASTGGVTNTDNGNSVVNATNTSSIIVQVVPAIAGAYTIIGRFAAPVTNRDLNVSYFNATRIG